MTKAKIIELIYVTSTAGTGKDENPYRQVEQLFNKDGKLVADYGSALVTKTGQCADMFDPTSLK